MSRRKTITVTGGERHNDRSTLDYGVNFTLVNPGGGDEISVHIGPSEKSEKVVKYRLARDEFLRLAARAVEQEDLDAAGVSFEQFLKLFRVVRVYDGRPLSARSAMTGVRTAGPPQEVHARDCEGMWGEFFGRNAGGHDIIRCHETMIHRLIRPHADPAHRCTDACASADVVAAEEKVS